MGSMAIGEVARWVGVAASAIRYCEKAGLIPEPRRVSGQRRYGPEITGRLAVCMRIEDCERAIAERAPSCGKTARGPEVGTAFVSRRGDCGGRSVCSGT